jgi:5-methylcytosine-specific restriction endonuclease McrBC regulatory subunit McrC
MHTDVVLRKVGRTIVLDTKFTPKAFSTFRGSMTVRPEHMYQMFAYMANLRLSERADSEIEGVLVYPNVNEKGFHLHWNVHGMPLRVTSLDLAEKWPVLKGSLLSLLSS